MRVSSKLSVLVFAINITTVSISLVSQNTNNTFAALNPQIKYSTKHAEDKVVLITSEDLTDNAILVNIDSKSAMRDSKSTMSSEPSEFFYDRYIKTTKTISVATPPGDNAYTVNISPAKTVTSHVVNNKAIDVRIKNTKNSTVNISLVDSQGQELFNQARDNKRLNERLNLKNLPFGNYNLIIKKDLIKTIQPFEINIKGVVMSEKSMIKKYLPQIIQRGKSFDVNVLLNKIDNIQVRVYDNLSNLIFADNNKNGFKLNKRYDLTKFGNGVFTVEVIADDEAEYLTVNLF